MILADFARALSQLSDARFARVFFLGVGLTLALFVGSFAGVLWLIDWATADGITLPGGYEVTWLGDFLSWGSFLLMLVASIFLMVPVASAITSLFLDDVADAVEDHWYPHLPQVRAAGWTEGIVETLRFLGLLIFANLVAFTLSVAMPLLAPLLFYATNGFLLGREYFLMAARRHMPPEEAQRLYRENAGEVFVAGVLMSLPLSIPLVNLTVPVLAAATFTHLFIRRARL